MADLLLPETTWIKSSTATIRSILKEIDGHWRAPVVVEVSAPLSRKISVHLTDDALGEFVLRDNTISHCDDAVGVWTLYYLIGPRPAAARISTPFAAYFSERSRTVVFFGSPEYGLLRSTLIGLASYDNLLQGYNPLHAAWIEVQGRSYLILGGHGTGKSFFAFSVLSLFGKEATVRIYTDDWLFFSFPSANGLPVLWSRPTLSLTPRDYATWKNVFRLPIAVNFDYHGGKVYIHPDDILGPSSDRGEPAPLSKIVVLRSGSSSPELLCEFASDDLSRLKREVNYHVPTTPLSHRLSLTAWRNLLQGVPTTIIGTKWLTTMSATERSAVIPRLLGLI